MTACLVYHPTFNSYSSFRTLQARGHHKHPQEAVDLRQGSMLEEAPSSMSSSSSQVAANPLFPLTVAAERILQTRPLPHLQHHQRTLEASSALGAGGEGGVPPRSAFTPSSHRGEGVVVITPTSSPGHQQQNVQSDPSASPTTPQSHHHHYQQHRAMLLDNGGVTSPLSASSIASSPEHHHHPNHHHGHPHHQSHHLSEDAKSRQSAVSSPHSTIVSDNEDEYVDMDMDKSDSSSQHGDSSPRGKRGDNIGGQVGDVSGGSGGGSGEKKVYRCQHCKYTTDRKNNLKRHVITMHEMCPKQLECCDVVFKNKASLRDHVVKCHKNGYDCRVCGRTFCRKALLKRHITVHSGQKDYICGVCGYATSHKSNLDRHKRRHGPKFGGGADGSEDGGDAQSKSPTTPVPPTSGVGGHPQQQQSPSQFTSHKPNPLDVSNLVSNNNSRYGGYQHGTVTSIHRPEPLRADAYCSPPPGHLGPLSHHHLSPHHHPHHPAHHQPGLWEHHPAAAVPVPTAHQLPHPPPPPAHRRHRQHSGSRFILSKRLLYTYRRENNENDTSSMAEEATEDSLNTNNNNTNQNDDHYGGSNHVNNTSNNNNNNSDSDENHRNNNNNYDDRTRCMKQEGRDSDTNTLEELHDREMRPHHPAYLDRQVRLGLEKRMTAKRLLSHSSRKLRLSTKRLFPALYMCRRCCVVYENQLQLTEHVDRKHRDDDCPLLPQRPLTLQARPRAW